MSGLWSAVTTWWHSRRAPNAPVVGVGMEYDRRPDPAWQAALDAQHVPGTARVVIAWEAGDAWQPIHRWMLWQLQSWEFVPDAIRQELQGPHPRSRGHYCAAGVCGCQKPVNRWKDGATSLIDRRTWELARAVYDNTGTWTFPRRLWVLQGHGGGHPYRISQAEQKWRQELGLPANVPPAGALPFAPFDRRVVVALERYDLWRYAHGLGDPMTAAARMTIRRMQATEVEAHRLMWSKWESLAAEWADGAAFAARQDGLHYHRWTPVGSRARSIDYDAARAHYLMDTDVEDAA